jgi:hypothetical protein
VTVTHRGARFRSSICLVFFSRIENLFSKLDALTRFFAPLLLTDLTGVVFR